MIEADFTVDTRALLYEMGRFQADSKKNASENLKATAKAIIKRVIAITPPSNAQGSGSAGRQMGEAAIARDLTKIFMPVKQEFIDNFINLHGSSSAFSDFGHKGAKAIGQVEDRVMKFTDMAAWHHARRNRSTGRVQGAGKKGNLNRFRAAMRTTGTKKNELRSLDIGIVEEKDFARYKKLAFKTVGLLASGWNAAASALGAAVPAWIKRHGTARGDVKLTLTGDDIRFCARNEVAFVGNVKDLQRRVQFAVNAQAAALKRRVEFYLEKRAARVGR